MELGLDTTGCCALVQLRADNGTPLNRLQDLIEALKKEATAKKWTPVSGDGGWTSIFCITVHPMEPLLEEHLTRLGFKLLTTLKRRNGYPQKDGQVNYMWFKELV